MSMNRYTIHRVAHCNEGYGNVLGTIENCPTNIMYIIDLYNHFQEDMVSL